MITAPREGEIPEKRESTRKEPYERYPERVGPVERAGPVRRQTESGRRAPPRKRIPYKRPAHEKYKSRGEKLIAGFLEEAGIKFLYEYPLIIIDDDNKIRVWYPDFWLPELSIVVEYFGMVNDEQYREQMKKKQDLFTKLDINFIGLDTNMVQLSKNWEKFIVMRIMEIMDSKRPIYRRLERLKEKYTWA